jgi:branched-chain amino acid aminotransferase
MFDEAQWLWMDGAVVPWNDATVHVSAHALHYGTGVFEGIRCYETPDGPAVFRLDAHLDRLFASAETYGIWIPCTRKELFNAVLEVVQRNGFQSCYIRPICFHGSHSLGLLPDRCPVHVSVMAWPWDPLHGNAALKHGVRVDISRWLKFSGEMMPTTAKACGQYLNSILALRAANGAGCQDSILLNVQGSVAEASGENLFIVKDNMIATNGEGDSILLGVTRDSVVTLARDLGLPVQIRTIELPELLNADEAFLTGTAAEITPIREVGDAVLGCGRPGPVTQRLQQTYSGVVRGHNPPYRHWLSYVSQESNCDRAQ